MSELIFDNGSKADIKILPFQEAIELKNVLFKSIADSKISMNSLKGIQTDTLITIELIEPLVNSVLFVDSNPKFNEVLMKCLGRCLYNGVKITYQTFEEIESREHYYPIVIELIKVNIIPFFKGLASRLQALLRSPQVIQK